MSSKIHRAALALLLGLLALPSTQAQPATSDPADASRVFPYEAPIRDMTAGGVARLPIPAAVLAEAAPNLADVRIHDANGEELPYLIDSDARPARGEPTPRELDATILNTSRRIEGAESQAPIYIERFELSPPRVESGLADGSWSGRRWALVFATPRGRFVAQVVVTWAAMERQMPLAEGSIYRFPSPERSGLTLPLEFAPEQPEEDARVVVEIRGGDGYLEPTLRFRSHTSQDSPPTLTIPLEESLRTSENGKTTIHLIRPQGIVPDRLQISTTTANFHRDVRVLDVAQGQAPSTIGHGLAYRLREVRDAEELSIPLLRASGQTLTVEIEDEDSPPLDGLHFSVEVTQPVLVFTGVERAMLRFGGGRVRAPRYDLMGIRSSLTDGSGAERARVRLGEIRPNPSFDAGPALAFALTAGRPVALRDFAYRAKIRVTGASEGLSRVDLSPEVLAGANDALHDLRVVDADGRQRPYVLGAEESQTLELRVPSAEVQGENSVYELTLPASPLRVSRLTLDTDASFLARRLRVTGTLENGRVATLMNTFLARPPDTHEPLVVELNTARVRDLRLEFDDGGDAPIELSRVSLEVVGSPLFLVAPDGDYTLYFGDPGLQAPVYELSRARALVLSLPAATTELGALERNPAHVPPAWYEGADGQAWLVWSVLILALLVLAVLTLRVVRSEPEEEPDDPRTTETTKTTTSSTDPASDPAQTKGETKGEHDKHDGHTESDG